MSELSGRIKRRLYRELKEVYQQYISSKKDVENILFIIGCQRSGTTLVTKIFEKDYSVKNYQEKSSLSSLHSTKLRLNPLDQVAKEINKNNAKTVVLKPLVETQNIDKLFSYFPNSKALWVYRNYRDVASSDLKKFGIRNGIENIHPIYDKNPDNWRSDRVSESTYKIIREHYAEDMSPQDAAALFWYSRNILFFERKLYSNIRIRICKYEELVVEPEKTFKSIYRFLNTKFPKGKLVAEVHPGSLLKGKDFKLSPSVEKLCQELLEKLDDAFYKQNKL